MDDLAERVRRMEAEQERLRARVAQLERGWQVVPDPAPGARSAGPAAQVPSTPAQPPPGHARRPIDAAGLEQRIGGRWLAYAGIVVFVIGAVFFLRLAIDQGWLGPLARVVLGVVAGVGLWATGAWLDRRMPERVYGQVLAAGGALVLYFTVFAAHFFPSLQAVTGIGLRTDAVLLGSIAAGLAAHAAVRRAQALAHASLVLAGVTSIAAGSWSSFSVAYLVAIVAVMVAVAAWRRWPVVHANSLGAFVILLAGPLTDVDPAARVAGAVGLLTVFAAAAFWRMEWPRFAADALQGVAFLFAWVVIVVALGDADQDTLQGPVTLALALAAAGLALVGRLRPAPSWGWGLASAALVFIWAPVQFDGAVVALVWALWCGAAGALTAWRPLPGVGAPWLAGGVVLWFRLQAEELQLVDAGLIPIAWALVGLLAGLAMLLPAWSARMSGPWSGTRFAAGSALGLWVLLATAEAVLDGPLVSIVWAAVAVAVLGAGAAMKRRDVRLSGIATFVPVLGRVVIVDLADVDPVLRVLSYLGVGALLLAVSFLYARQIRRQAPPAGDEAVGIAPDGPER